jgi:hypothetical protein
MERATLVASLESAKAEMSRCMGGVDPDGCVVAARRVASLRAALRNDAGMIEHFMNALRAPIVPRPSSGRGKSSRSRDA